MRWVVALVFLVVACAAVIATNTTLTDTRDGGSEADFAENETDSRQELYNGFLETARSDLEGRGAETQSAVCEPEYQQRLIDNVPGGLSGGEKAIFQVALIDSCIEVGAYPDYVEYSSYHDAAMD